MPKITIKRQGAMFRSLYTEAIDLTAFGQMQVERASHVEYDNKRQGWVVTILAFGAPYALPGVYKSRADALAAEVEHLEGRL